MNDCNINELQDPLNIGDLLKDGAQFQINNDFEDTVPEYFFPDDYGSDEEDEETFKKLFTPWDKSFAELRAKMIPISDHIYKLVTKEGVGQVVPCESRVEIDYNAYFEHEVHAFDSTSMRGEFKKFQLGNSEVLRGLEEAVLTMKVGEEAQFVISYELLFGELGCLPRIKAKADALFIIKLIRFVETGDSEALEKLTKEEQNKFSSVRPKIVSLRNNAKEAFRKHNFNNAIKSYQKAVFALQRCELKDEEEQKEQTELLVNIFTSLAVCYNKTNNPARACSMCNDIKTLTNIDKNCKALFQEGRALLKLGEYTRAKSSLIKARNLNPQDQVIKAELELLNEKYVANKKDEKKIWTKAFGVIAEKEEKQDTDNKFIEVIKKNIDIFVEGNTEKFALPNGLTEQEILSIEELVKDMKVKLSFYQKNNVKYYSIVK